MPSVDTVLADAAVLADGKQYTQAYDLLKACAAGAGGANPTVLWRFSEACNNAIEDKPKEKGAWRLGLINEGLASTEKCLTIAPHDAECHKWHAVVGSKWGDMQSLSDKIKNSYKVRDHAQQAVAINPKDGVSQHLLGAFCFHVANISWIERKVAATLFNEPPQATFEEAVTHLAAAHTLTPNFIRNALMLGDAHRHMKRPAEAKEWYQTCVGMQPTCALEEEQHAQCKKELGKL